MLRDWFYYDFKYDADVNTDLATANGTWTPTVPTELETDDQTVLEPYRVEIFPPMQGGAVQDLEYVMLRIAGEDYEHIWLDELMTPPVNEASPVLGLDLGIPILAGLKPWYSFDGKLIKPANEMPGTLESGRCPKLGPKKKMGIKVKTVDALSGTMDFIVRIWIMRVRGESMLRRVLGNSIEQSITLENIEENKAMTFSKPSIPVTLSDFTKLAGGNDQVFPKVFPLITYSLNKVATTVNTEYEFNYDSGNVSYEYRNLKWNLEDEEAVRITHLGVAPAANSLQTRFNLEGRDKNPWFITRQYENAFPIPLAQSGTLVSQGFSRLPLPWLLWSNKGSITHQDNGTLIAADGVKMAVLGNYLKLK